MKENRAASRHRWLDYDKSTEILSGLKGWLLSDEKYEDHVKAIEARIGRFGFKSVDGQRLDESDAISSVADEWKSSEGRARLTGRTPVSLDRDRILYSEDLRRQDDKFHVLFFGATRLSRTYTSHTLKSAHVARAVAPRLGLNPELTEAMVLGSKVGGVPFLHVGKKIVAEWVQERIASLDADHLGDHGSNSSLFDFDVRTGEILPNWIEQIKWGELRQKVALYLPWATGLSTAGAYASGQQSYWSLSLNPYTLEPKSDAYLAQTMYGVWRHTLVKPTLVTSGFHHRLSLLGKRRAISDRNATHEAVLGRYCDDITWILENLSEASRVAAVDGTQTAQQALGQKYQRELDDKVLSALATSDTGRLYTYFIDDLVTTSKALMDSDGDPNAPASEIEPLIRLSERGQGTLDCMETYLELNVFAHERIKFRNETL